MTLKKLLLKFLITRSVILVISISFICSMLISGRFSADFCGIFFIIAVSSTFIIAASALIIWHFLKINLIVIENKLEKFYENIDNGQEQKPYLTGFQEIDSLFEAFKNNKRIFTLDFKNSVSGDIIGIFEFDYNRMILIISKSILFLFNTNDYKEYDDIITIPLDKYNDYIKAYKKSLHTSEENLYYYDSPEGRQWYNIFENQCRPVSFGFVVDATERIKNYQNAGSYNTLYSYDVLMDKVKPEKLEKGKCLSIVSLELNSLKKINNNYGYRTGNDFIKKCEKQIFSIFTDCFIGKKSNFEFIIFLSSFDENILEEKIRKNFDLLSKSSFNAPDGKSIRYSFNGGYSIMPFDTNSFENLLKYANYALYESKNKYKGTLQRFSIKNYSHQLYVQKKLESFNKLIDNNELYYLFQPIVNLSNGDIFAYEALAYPKSRIFSSPYEIIEVASQENMTYVLERLNVINCLEIVKNNKDVFRNKILFYRTVCTQTLTAEDTYYLKNKYPDIGYMLVPEISELYPESDIIKKCGVIKDNGDKAAIDRYTGKFTDFENIFKIKPSYIKLDPSMIIDINTNKGNQAFIASFTKYAKKNNVIICADGIETYSQLKEAVRLGIDYAQGYYFGIPEKDFIQKIELSKIEEIKELNNRKFL